MNSIKCSQCGLVNFANSFACKRCNFQFQNYSQPHEQSYAYGQQQTFTSQTTAANGGGYASSYQQESAAGSETASKAVRKMIFGALWAIGGTVATVIGYSAASGGGKYIVFWGAILFGAVDFIAGLSAYIGSKD